MSQCLSSIETNQVQLLCLNIFKEIREDNGQVKDISLHSCNSLLDSVLLLFHNLEVAINQRKVSYVIVSYIKRVGGFVLIAVLFVSVNLILIIYGIKAPWYGPTFLPPSGYTYGPLSKDQGNTI